MTNNSLVLMKIKSEVEIVTERNIGFRVEILELVVVRVDYMKAIIADT